MRTWKALSQAEVRRVFHGGLPRAIPHNDFKGGIHVICVWDGFLGQIGRASCRERVFALV